MLRSCALTLLLWLALGAGYYFYLHASYAPPADWIGALAGSFATLLGIGCLRNIAFYQRDYRNVAGSRYSFVPSEPGLLAVSGRIQSPSGGASSPFSRTPCAFYSYEAYEETSYTVRDGNSRRHETQRKVIFSGFRLAPSEIRGPMGAIKLLGFPTLEGFFKENIDPVTAIPAALEFTAATTFEDMSGFKLGKAFSALRELLTDDDGTIDKNWQMEQSYGLESLSFEEELVPLGEEVCAVGYYLPERRGLVPHLHSGNIIRLYRGTPETVLGTLRRKILGYCFGAVIFLAGCNAVLWFVLEHMPQSSEGAASGAEGSDD